jgi:ligand-binding sensor protein
MINLMNGSIDLKSLEIEDIIDIETLQKFLDNFAIGMNCAAVSVNRDGKEITKPSHYRTFCSDYIHASSLGDSRCAQCHSQMGAESVKSGKPYIGSCHAGLIDFAAPIIVKGEHLGTVLGGQILDSNPKEDKMQKVAQELSLSESKLWEAAQNIDIVNKKNIEAAADVLFIVVNTLAQDGYNRIETEFLSNKLVNNFFDISKTIDMLAESAQNITASQHDLSNEIREINTVTKEVEQVLDSITKVANKTKLIGLNASIEAARLGNDGRGFTIVANEIQKLSENTKSTTVHINNLNNQINYKINTTINNSNMTLEITQDQSAAMEELSATIQNSLELAEQLKTLISNK